MPIDLASLSVLLDALDMLTGYAFAALAKPSDECIVLGVRGDHVMRKD